LKEERSGEYSPFKTKALLFCLMDESIHAGFLWKDFSKHALITADKRPCSFAALIQTSMEILVQKQTQQAPTENEELDKMLMKRMLEEAEEVMVV
jgi:hypothetical protein